MSKNNRKKIRAKRKKNLLKNGNKPDESFQIGKVKLERFGKNVVMSNDFTSEDINKIREQSKEINKEILLDIEKNLTTLQQNIKKFSPLKLMHHAVYEAIGVLMQNKTESEMSPSEVKVLPSLEYLQYLIPRTEFNSKSEEISDEEWKSIWKSVNEIIDLTSNYLSTRVPKNNPPSDMDMLMLKYDSMRLLVRVKRHPNFMETYWRQSLTPFNSKLIEVYGIGAEEIVDELVKIYEYQKRGIGNKHNDMFDAMTNLHEKAVMMGFDPRSEKPEEMSKYEEALKSGELKKLNEDAHAKTISAFTEEAFELEGISDLPDVILDILSVKPGEEPLYELTGPNHEDLSPMTDSALHKRPFLNTEGKHYTFFHSGIEDSLVELIEADLMSKLSEAEKTKYIKKKSDYAENESVELLSKILNPDRVHQNIYYPNPDEDGDFTEVDGLIEIDDILIILEVKSGGLSTGTTRGAPLSVESDLKDLIIEGQRQSERAERYLKSSSKVKFYDESHKNIVHEIEYGKFRKVFRVVVTNEQLGWVGSKLAQLSLIDPTLSASMPWHVSLDDLRSLSELLDNQGEIFAHYAEQRLDAATFENLMQHDELEHYALYLRHNHYQMIINKDASMTSFHGSYQMDIDKYFMDLESGEEPEKPSQEIPLELKTLLENVHKSGLSGRFPVVSILLSQGIEGRKAINKRLVIINSQVDDGKTTVFRIMNTVDDFGITVSNVPDGDLELEKLRLVKSLINQDISKGYLVQLKRNSLEIKEIKAIQVSDFSDAEIKKGEELLEKSVRHMVGKNAVARNQMCPCASGERFKNCHGK